MNKVVVITGAGAGLGRAIARQLASDGHKIVLLGRTLSKVESVASELGAPAYAAHCDVSDADSVYSAFSTIMDRSTTIDVLINNAAIYEPFSIADATNDQVAAALNINLVGSIFCSRAVINHMQKGGHIINISSGSAVSPLAMMALYSASKAGLERFSKTLNQEVTPLGIRVTLVRASGMYDEDSRMNIEQEIARRFVEENLKHGVDYRTAPVSHFKSVAKLFSPLLELPDDVNIPEMVIDARHS